MPETVGLRASSSSQKVVPIQLEERRLDGSECFLAVLL